MTSDILQALDDVVDLGFQRVLTSGGSSSALEGLPMIQQMVERVCHVCQLTSFPLFFDRNQIVKF